MVSIIDDEMAVRRGTSSLLRSLGFSVKTFVSAEEFLSSNDIAKTFCIVSDVQMPGMSGIDLYEHIRAQDRQIPFIFITAFSETLVRSRVGGEICVLQKPFAADKLVEFIRSVVPAAD
ncbi:response regulator transcription factor [Rhizobium oryzicola]|uniref:Response regulator n=1 Tax=Rhizobium oryzicola TaxID=1232668 RepID=A0ABT8T3G9_9HYPH|nr:response regulator [Rhizobium oryzicola]MDO1585299.1 response regulator [Rhizobium oryzicola]